MLTHIRQMLIYMMLSPGTLPNGERLFRGQETIQVILLLIAVVQVPIMLLLKPLWLNREHKRARAKGYRGIGEFSRVSALEEDEDGQANGRGDSLDDGVAMISQNADEEHEEFDFSEEMIHQVRDSFWLLARLLVVAGRTYQFFLPTLRSLLSLRKSTNMVSRSFTQLSSA
jgi:hypothetical protein